VEANVAMHEQLRWRRVISVHNTYLSAFSLHWIHSTAYKPPHADTGR